MLSRSVISTAGKAQTKNNKGGYQPALLKEENKVNLTEEQRAIVEHDNDLRINAFAGTGKTTTLLEYSKRRPNSRILYIAFNRSVKEEAIKKFHKKGLNNVTIETAHSLAYKATGAKKYKISSGLRTFDIADILGLKPKLSDNLYHLILAKHIIKLLTYFCNSNVQTLKDLDYLETINDKSAYLFAKGNIEKIENCTLELINKMYRREIEIIHDFYLKLYQLSNPHLNYDYILFDEGQDASPVMLDVFLKQSARKIIVGDEHQQIYGFRYAVNSLEKVNFDKLYLTNSFRFRQDIANLAMVVLYFKKCLGCEVNGAKIIGAGNPITEKSHAVLARSNIGLLDRAIEEVFFNRVKKVYFEGNINSYTFASDGASIYDVLNLYLNQRNKIRNSFIKCFNSFEDLEKYIKDTEDVELDLIASIVEKYGVYLFTYLPGLKKYQVKKEEAQITFSTVHKSKGMEYDLVELADDFITEHSVNKIVDDLQSLEKLEVEGIKEEINILYVAMTRAKNKLYVPKSLFKKASEILKQSRFIKKMKEVRGVNR